MAYRPWYSWVMNRCKCRVLRVLIVVLVVIGTLPQILWAGIMGFCEGYCPVIKREFINAWNWKKESPR